MYISPNTIIRLLTDVPLDLSYTHTLYFNDKAQQYDYFVNKTKYILTGQTYQRANNGAMRVQYKAEDLYDCNYLMYQNTSFGDKWFYAFVTKIDYINNVTAEISFTLDVMQTWLFDYTLKQSFVVREHSATDIAGNNTVPEQLEIGPYVLNSRYQLDPDNMVIGWGIIFVTTFNDDEELSDATGRLINGVYSGLNYIGYTGADSIDRANNLITRIIGLNKWDGVLAVYMTPFNYDSGSTSSTLTQVTHAVSCPKNLSDLDNYKPKNKKLFTYPYNLLHVTSDTSSADFRYELFTTPSCSFDIITTVVPSPSMILLPVNYATTATASGASEKRYEHRLAISEYPQCSIIGDVYKIYMAQNAASLPTKMSNLNLKSAVNTGLSALNGLIGANGSGAGIIGAAGGVISSLVDWATETRVINAQLSDIDTKPPQATGTQTTASDFFAGLKIFRAENLCISAEYAKIIDDYFSLYGYATNRVKIPNRNVRKQWTYTKTLGINIIAKAPSDDIATICKIYDNGITFWRHPENVGNYTLDNSPG